MTLVSEGRSEAALPIARRSAQLCAAETADSANCAGTLAMAAELADQLNLRELAAQWTELSIQAVERSAGPESPAMALALADHARRLARVWRGGDAIEVGTRAYTLSSRLLGEHHRITGSSRQALADALRLAGHYDESERLHRMDLAAAVAVHGANSPAAGAAWDAIGYDRASQLDYEGAARAFTAAVDAWAIPGDIQPLGWHNARVNLAVVRTRMGDLDGAQAVLTPSLDSPVLTIDRQAHLAAQQALARIKLRQGNAVEAVAISGRLFEDSAGTLGPDHVDRAHVQMMLARGLQALDRAAEALDNYRAAIQRLDRLLGAEHPDTIAARAELAALLEAQGARDEAGRELTLATNALVARASRSALDPARAAYLVQGRDVFAQQLDHLASAGDRDAAIVEAFGIAQWMASSEGALALSRVALRRAGGQDQLADLEERQFRLAADRAAVDSALRQVTAVSADMTPLIGRREAIDSALAGLEREIAGLDADHYQLSRPTVATLASVQAVLRDDEALLLALPTANQTHLFLVQRNSAAWLQSSLAETELTELVMRIRTSAEEDVLWQENRFDRSAAAALYQSLIAPIEGRVASGSRLLVMGAGPLTSLPFALLPTDGAEGPTNWLVDRYRLVSLPSPALLVATRSRPAMVADSGIRTFAGIGAPLLSGVGSPPVRGALWRSPSYSRVMSGGLADTRVIAAMSPLAGAARELEAVANLFTQDASLLAGPAASEAVVRTDPRIANARHLLFATHGLVAAESTVGEPGLVLTPPEQPSADNDGLLAASEIALLDLSAGTVVLSACNSARPDDALSRGGLGALVRAFMAAGASNVVATYWQIGDESADRLVTEFYRQLAMSGEPDIALQAAMATVRSDPRWSSPGHWAAFALAMVGPD